ncbi:MULTISPECIES: hypothetical protein [unclassified Streptomyces]|uniref:hypothetical protein n=1 Tax=unclassified Streptomyces TaxID=2593676 RepID=UPI0016616BB1|nr:MULTISPECIES: hypothetical protein [unclassified Streptomyces]MBD0707057.1 hypothetical protein [Streptomyces sp. CBMA291]MBD0714314.1 hypothetical protein [Streptomyces sp. CBMA370]
MLKRDTRLKRFKGLKRFAGSRGFRTAAVALVAAFAAVLGLATSASAVWGFPGEGGDWKPVNYAGGQITSRSSTGEARDNRNNIVHVWRGADNDNLYISLNSGPAYVLPGAQTWTPPRVIWTDDGGRGNFRVFHTGTEGHVYQHRVQLTPAYQLPATLPDWTRIPNDTRTTDTVPVAVAALPNNSFMLAWNSQSNDDIWTMYYNGETATYGSPAVVPNALSKDAPALAAQVDTDNSDPAPWNQVVLAFTGTDNRVYLSRQRYGSSGWTSPRQIFAANTYGWTRQAPSVALSRSGYGVISLAEDRDSTIGSYIISRDGGWSGYYEENTFANTYGKTPLAVIDGTAFYYVINGTASGLSGVLWKKAYDFAGSPTPSAPQW